MIALREGATELHHEHFHRFVILFSKSISRPSVLSTDPLPNLNYAAPSSLSGILEVQSKKKNDQFYFA